ncbi:MAG TPA: hypothetical protein VFX43_18625 [Chitinophagaceae bacterium]|nr:hypothetical protein [Chitinophagaceae bacterium]
MIFSHISWGKYLMVIALIVLAYYLVIGIKYCGLNILKRLFRRPQEIFPGSGPSHSSNDPAPQGKETTAPFELKKGWDKTGTLEEQVAPLLAETTDLIQHIREIISSSMAENLERTRILGILNTLFKTYPHLRDTRIMVSINRLVASEFNKYGSYNLREDELKEMWIV